MFRLILCLLWLAGPALAQDFVDPMKPFYLAEPTLTPTPMIQQPVTSDQSQSQTPTPKPSQAPITQATKRPKPKATKPKATKVPQVLPPNYAIEIIDQQKFIYLNGQPYRIGQATPEGKLVDITFDFIVFERQGQSVKVLLNQPEQGFEFTPIDNQKDTP